MFYNSYKTKKISENNEKLKINYKNNNKTNNVKFKNNFIPCQRVILVQHSQNQRYCALHNSVYTDLAQFFILEVI